MGKNTHGGAGHKKFARKHNEPVNRVTQIKANDDPNKLYAIATKMLGNNMIECHCVDNNPRLCHIRGRFAGRSKRDNIVGVGSWILIGLREWESSHHDATDDKDKNGKKRKRKLEQCDLLEIYDNSSKELLKNVNSNINWSILYANDLSKVETETKYDNIDDDDEFKFMTERDEEVLKITEQIKSSVKRIAMEQKNADDADEGEDEVNVDDI